MALSGTPTGCIEFYGITNLPDNEGGEELHLVMERATNGPIWEHLKSCITENEKFAWPDMVDIFSSIAHALWNGLHQKGIAHGYSISLLSDHTSDLHDKNVLVTKRLHGADYKYPETYSPVLIDFGRGIAVNTFAPNNSGSDDKMTASLGSTSKEIPIENQEYCIAGDIDAYGALTWELSKRFMRLKKTKIPRAVVDIFAKCMAIKEEDRPTMREVVKMFDELEEDWMDESGSAIPEMSEMEAEVLLRPSLEFSPRSTARPKPSAPDYIRSALFSHEKIDW